MKGRKDVQQRKSCSILVPSRPYMACRVAPQYFVLISNKLFNSFFLSLLPYASSPQCRSVCTVCTG